MVEGETVIICDSTCLIDPALANLVDQTVYYKPDNANT